jgi:hypothetical protein
VSVTRVVCYCPWRHLVSSDTSFTVPALLNIHFEVGNLILADALPSTFVFIDQNFSPYDLRLCACRSIINALNLALQTNSPRSNDPPGFNILLLDPHPDLMTNAIIRAGSSLFILYEIQKLTRENVTTMFSVVITALETLAKISHTAAEAIPLLQKKYATFIDRAMAISDATPHLNAFSVAAIDPGSFDSEVVQCLERQATDSSFLDLVVEQFENGQGSPSFPDELALIELESPSLDLDLPGVGPALRLLPT